jgi:hypothetical protein
MAQKQVDIRNFEEAKKRLLPGAEVVINGGSYRMDEDGDHLEPLRKISLYCLVYGRFKFFSIC